MDARKKKNAAAPVARIVNEADIFIGLNRAREPKKQSLVLPPATAPSNEDDGTRRGSTPTFAAKTPRLLLNAYPITTTEATLVWKFLADWVQAQLAMEVAATIPGFGTVLVKTHSMKIRIPFFEPDKAFMDKYTLRVEGAPELPPATFNRSTEDGGGSTSKTSEVFAFNFLEMASCYGRGIDASKAKTLLEAVVHKVGEALQRSPRVELNLGVGIVACTDHVIQQHMLPRQTAKPSEIPHEIRTGESIVKRNLQALALKSSIKLKAAKPTSSVFVNADLPTTIDVNPAFELTREVPSFEFDLLTSPRRPSIDGGQSHARPPVLSEPTKTSAMVLAPPARNQTMSPRVNRARLARMRKHESAPQDAHAAVSKAAAVVVSSLPALFDPLSRTFCVEPDRNLTFLSPSNRIAANYTLSAARVAMIKSFLPGHGGVNSTMSGIGLLDDIFPGSKFELATEDEDPLELDGPSKFNRRGVDATASWGSYDWGADRGDAHPHDSASEERYFAYLNCTDEEQRAAFDERCLAPSPPELTDRIVAAAVEYLREAPSGYMHRILRTAKREFVENYYFSVKKAMLDYLLMRRKTCQRLGIPHGTPHYTLLPSRWKWGDSNGVNGCHTDLKALTKRKRRAPPPRSNRHYRGKMHKRGPGAVAESTSKHRVLFKPADQLPVAHGHSARRKQLHAKLTTLLMQTDPQVRALQYMFHDLESSILLVDLPDVKKLCETMVPLDIYAFEKQQVQHAARMKAVLMDKWYTRARRMFEEITKSQVYSVNTSVAAVDFRTKHLFDAVAALMSLQMRALIMRSVHAYVEFFEHFGTPTRGRTGTRANAFAETESDNEPSEPVPEDWSSFSGLLISLALQNGNVQFCHPLEEIPSHLLSILHNLSQLFHNVNRIETQFEESLMLSSASLPFLWNVGSHEEEFVLATIRIREIIEQNLVHLRALQASYDPFATMYRYVCSVDSQRMEETCDLQTCRREMKQVKATVVQISQSTLDKQFLHLFCVDCKSVNAMLLCRLSQWTSHFLQAFADRTARLNAELRQQYKDVAARLAKKPLDLHELVESEGFVEHLKSQKLKELQEKSNEIKQRIQFLLFEREHLHVDLTIDTSSTSITGQAIGSPPPNTMFTLSPDLLASTAKTIKWRSHIERVLQDAEASLVNERARIETIFLAKRTRFQAEIEEFDSEVKSFAKKGDLRHAATYVEQLAKMKDALNAFRKSMQAIVQEEIKLQWKPTDFSKLDDIAEEMEPYEQMWRTARDFREMSSRWLRANVFELQAEEGQATLFHMTATMANVSKVLQLNSAAAAITAELVKKQMNDFRENARLVGAILNVAMQERHLKDISALVGIDIDPKEPLTLLKLLENGALDHIVRIVEISEGATLEKKIEDALEDIAEEWRGMQLRFKHVKRTDTHDLGQIVDALVKSSLEEIHVLIEDHQLRLQSILCMEHAAPFLARIGGWQFFMDKHHQLSELLLENERSWKVLSPLFSTGIIDAGSKEARLFESADKLYRSTLSSIQQQPICLLLVPHDENAIHTSLPLLSELQECRRLLDELKESICVGFESKRAMFPRFYFLSDTELVLVLSSRSPSSSLWNLADSLTLWKKLSRCFPGVARVNFNASKEITALVSQLGESLPIGTPIATVNVTMLLWMGKMEASMITILQACVRAAANDMARKEFRKWCLLWPEQVIVCTLYHTWTLQSEQANRKATSHASYEAWRVLVESLKDKITELLKEIKAAGQMHVKTTLSNVLMLLLYLRDVSIRITDEVHALDPLGLIGKASAKLPAATPHHPTPQPLTWLLQPRFYYEENTFCLKMLSSASSASLPYGFEYLGNASPAVIITPLTLRCFQSLFHTFSVLNKGGCIQGPVGTGKTTTCQALARLCGRLYVDFGCDHAQAKTEAMVQYLKGASSTAAWLCMDNFHMLSATQVSLVGQLCAQLMDTLLTKQSQSMLFGSKIKLKKGVAFLATLPLCAQSSGDHTRLAPQARFFFKSIVLQAPDTERIAEAWLDQCKFHYASSLSKLVFAVICAFCKSLDVVQGQPERYIQNQRNALLSLRSIKRVIARATELRDQKISAQHAPSAANAATTFGETLPSSADPSSGNSTRDIEKNEHRSMCMALKEHLTALIPTSNSELVDHLLRDFAANLVTRELRLTKSFFSARPGGDNERRLEDDLEHDIRTHESVWYAIGPLLCHKAIQLFQTMRRQRAVVVSGDIQSGKTSLYQSLSRSLGRLYTAYKENSRPKTTSDGSSSIPGTPQAKPPPLDPMVCLSRCIVVSLGALTLEQFLGMEHDGGDQADFNVRPQPSETFLSRIVREAKVLADKDAGTDTWLVLDGEIDPSWSDLLLSAVTDDADDGDVNGSKGLLVKSGKYLCLPKCVHVVIESCSLTHASPSFLSRVGMVHIDRATQGEDWRGFVRAWKKQHESLFGALAEETFEIVDSVTEETIDASLEFVHGNFNRTLIEQTRTSRVANTLALLQCFLQQAWPKLSTMASGKQRRTAMHCYYLQALVWGVGCTSDQHERQKFHEFLRHLLINGPRSTESTLKRVLILFFPSGTMGTGTASNLFASIGLPSPDKTAPANTPTNNNALGGGSLVGPAPRDTIYNYAFSIDFGLKWMRWGEFYDNWVQVSLSLGDQKGHGHGGHGALAMSGVGRGFHDMPHFEVGVHVEHTNTPTGNVAAGICLLNQLIHANHAALLTGPPDSGKTTAGANWLTISSLIQNANNAASGSLSQTSVGRPMTVYMGYCSTAQSVLLDLDGVLNRRRPIHRQKLHRHSTGVRAVDVDATKSGVVGGGGASSTSTFVFFDDLHHADCERTTNSSLELLRQMQEHHHVVHPTSSVLTSTDTLQAFASCSNTISPLTGRQSERGWTHLQRILRRFVPIALPAFGDHELLSVCTAIVESAASSGLVGPSATAVADSSYNLSQEASQLTGVVIKSSLKLLRTLTGEFAVGVTKSAFNLRKCHYTARAKDLLDVVRAVCVDSKMTFSFAEKPLIARLWCHEAARVFSDRHIDWNESAAFFQIVRDLAMNNFSLSPDLFFPFHSDNPINRDTIKNNAVTHLWLQQHLHFTFIGENSGAGFMEGYREVTEMRKVELSIERSMMTMYRTTSTRESLEIVMCHHTIAHLLRLTRVLRHPDRHVLLLGTPGNRLQTLTRLAAFICKKSSVVYHTRRTRTPEAVKDWHNTLKEVMLRCIRNRDEHIVFVLHDSFLTNDWYYDALERYLSGASYLPEVVTYEDLDEHLLWILREEAHQATERPDSSGIATSSPPSSRGHSRRFSVRAQQQQQQPQANSSRLMSSKRAVVEFFMTRVRAKLHFAIVLTPEQPATPSRVSTARATAALLAKFPHLLTSCAVNYFHEWPEESLLTIAHKCFGSLSLPDKERLAQLAIASVRIYQVAKRFMECRPGPAPIQPTGVDDDDPIQTTSERSTSDLNGRDKLSLPIRIDPSVLMDQVGAFVRNFERVQREICLQREKYTTGLAFLEQTEQILAAEQSQAAVLHPELRRRAETTRRMSGNLEKEKMATNKLSRAVELATNLLEAQRERLAVVEREYDELIRDSLAFFEMKKIAMMPYLEAMREEELTKPDTPGEAESPTFKGHNDNRPLSMQGVRTRIEYMEEEKAREARRRIRGLVKSFTSTARVPTSLRQLVECIGLIMNIAPVQSRDELDPDEIVMDYWESTAQRMKTVAFWEALVTFPTDNNTSEKTVAQLMPICNSPDFEVDVYKSVHELAGVLCDWIKACAAFSRDYVLAQPKFQQLTHEREAFVKAQANLDTKRLEIENQESMTSQVNAMRNLSELERKELEERLRDNTSTLQMASSVWRVLQSSKKQWKQAYDEYLGFSAQWTGDLMMATATMTYGAALPARMRQDLRRLWSHELTKLYVLHATQPMRPLHRVLLVDDRTLTRWKMDGLPIDDQHALESAVIAVQSYLFPVLLDPYGIATEWIKKYDAVTGLHVIQGQSVSLDALKRDIEQCIRKKQALMIVDFSEATILFLQSLIASKRRARFDMINKEIAITTSAARTSNLGAPSTNSGASPVGADNMLCWFELESTDPRFAQHHFEFEADSFRVYLVHTQSDQKLPAWFARFSTQLSIVRFDLSPSYIETRAMNKILESTGQGSILTEIQTLQIDVLSCDEQIEAIENEILDFVSVEHADQVFSDVSKALKVVSNRSALHTLESSRLDSTSKITTYYSSLHEYKALVERVLDVVFALQDMQLATVKAHICSQQRAVFGVDSVWKVLSQALRTCDPSAPLEEMTSLFTLHIRQFVSAALSDEQRLLFDVVLALRLHCRRCVSSIQLDDDKPSQLDAISSSNDDGGNDLRDLFFRLIVLLAARDKAERKQLCNTVSSKLLQQRPDALSFDKWRGICFLAEKSPKILEFVHAMADLTRKTGKDSWKELLDATATSTTEGFPLPVGITRVCLMAAINPLLFLGEVEKFSMVELTSVAPQASPTSPASLGFNMGTIVALASHTSASSCLRPYSLRELWKAYSTARTPLLVISNNETEFERHVEAIAARANATIDTTCQEATDDDSFEKCFLTAMQKGHWVVVPNVDTRRTWLQRLQRVYEGIDQNIPHSDFRLWVSVLAKPQHNRHVASNLVARDTVMPAFITSSGLRKHFSPSFAFRRTLHQAFSLIKNDSDCRNLEGKYEPYLVRLAVFHAVMSSEDQLAFASWRQQFEYGESDLRGLIHNLLTVDSATTSDHDLATTLQFAVSNIYGAKVSSAFDQLLIRCCFDVLCTIPPSVSLLDSARKAAPEVAAAFEQLVNLPVRASQEQILQLWPSEELGLWFNTTHGNQYLNPFHARKSRATRFVRALAPLVPTFPVSTAAPVPRTPKSSHGRASTKEKALSTLMRFCIDLEAISFASELVVQRIPIEYMQPLHAVVQRELAFLETVRETLLHDIRLILELESGLGCVHAPLALAMQFLLAGLAPKAWVDLFMGRSATCASRSAADTMPWEEFEAAVFERLNFFAVWLEQGQPLKIPIYHFRCVQSTLEAIHQHFIRNHVGNALCAPYCLRVIHLWEDQPSSVLSKREESLYVSGFVAVGELVNEIASVPRPSGPGPVVATESKRSISISSNDGDDAKLHQVVLEISSSCMTASVRHSAKSHHPVGSKHPAPTGAPHAHPTHAGERFVATTEYPCPILRMGCSGGNESVDFTTEATLCVVSSLPLAQLALSGSSLHIWRPTKATTAVPGGIEKTSG
ncbi:TPA: hypothetical protein N0F65_010535 [Lagenidium giganteum]|uniref:Dynein heavy chain n=1 Tax=Lagenidium giganteum TaxID=4803 RepID=A0AAV2ZA06_9STRA|nr:TPA: hypothetical protein N0F65_010535 [Lagenidium giganteum]